MPTSTANPPISPLRPEAPVAAPTLLVAVAAGFAISVAMWAVGYVCRLAPDVIPAPILGAGMLACLVAGGVLLGRRSPGSWPTMVAASAVSATVNLLILGSLIRDPAAATGSVPSELIWVPGAYFATVVCVGLGWLIGRRAPAAPWGTLGWRTVFMIAALASTALVIVAGGLVTSHEAGLAVPDWPNSFGSNMFLYPLSRMTGGIYYEHAHRLAGALVGLCTIVLLVIVFTTDRRAWLRQAAIAAMVLVVAQGVMGGLRVTGEFTMDELPATAPSTTLAIVHGVTGQIFFAFIALFAAWTSRTWLNAVPRSDESLVSDRSLTMVLVVALLGQLVLGAMFRHLATDEQRLPWPAMAHITLAALVLILAVLAGLRAWSQGEGGGPAMRRRGRLGVGLVVLVALQLVLGIAALVPILADRPEWRGVEIALATAHQANGALLLLLAVQIAAWTRRVSTTTPVLADAAAA